MARVSKKPARPETEDAPPSVSTFVVLTGERPMLVVTHDGVDPVTALRQGLRRRGHTKFFACRVSPDEVRRIYGSPFEVVANGVSEGRPVRVLDFDGARVFDNLSLHRIGPPVPVETRPRSVRSTVRRTDR